jgi:hypothetical protein
MGRGTIHKTFRRLYHGYAVLVSNGRFPAIRRALYFCMYRTSIPDALVIRAASITIRMTFFSHHETKQVTCASVSNVKCRL